MKPEITQAVKSAVNAYLLTCANAEVHREKVDAIQRNILATANYYTDEKFLNRGRTIKEKIIETKDTWFMSSGESHDYFSDLRMALERSGYKIESTPGDPEWSYSCPALTAECLQTDAEHILIDAAAEMLGETKDFRDKLLCNGMDNWNKFIDLVVGLVVNMPGFKNPLTGEVQI